MKILTGRLRGQTILFKPNPHLRPTSDKARKAVFDMLQGALSDKSVLDLFSGTGALGLEALSQGARHVTFVEQDSAQCRRITENLERLKLKAAAEVLNAEVLDWLGAAPGRREKFDLIFLDPPYAADVATQALEGISRSRLVAPGGFVILECRKREDVPPQSGELKAVREKRYGQTKLTVYAAIPGSRGGSF